MPRWTTSHPPAVRDLRRQDPASRDEGPWGRTAAWLPADLSGASEGTHVPDPLVAVPRRARHAPRSLEPTRSCASSARTDTRPGLTPLLRGIGHSVRLRT